MNDDIKNKPYDQTHNNHLSKGMYNSYHLNQADYY